METKNNREFLKEIHYYVISVELKNFCGRYGIKIMGLGIDNLQRALKQ